MFKISTQRTLQQRMPIENTPSVTSYFQFSTIFFSNKKMAFDPTWPVLK
jgi:hypothetical protein